MSHRDMATVDIAVGGDDWQLRAQVTVPTAQTHVAEMLPLVRSLSDAVVGAAVEAVERSGETISCKKGCGACCRKLVAISEIEARAIRALIERLPEPRR